MWIVVQDWDGYESVVHEFTNEEEAREYYGKWIDHTSAKMYLADVKQVNRD